MNPNTPLEKMFYQKGLADGMLVGADALRQLVDTIIQLTARVSDLEKEVRKRWKWKINLLKVIGFIKERKRLKKAT